MRELVTTILDAVGLLAVAAGGGLYVSQWIGWGGLVVSGVAVVGGVRLAELVEHGEDQ